MWTENLFIGKFTDSIEKNPPWDERVKRIKLYEFFPLRGFADSSGVAYFVVIYMSVVCSFGVSCNLWTTRSRLVPIKIVWCHG